MKEYRNRQIGELSGGQQQRVFLARSLVQNALIYFLDEPFGGIDSKTEKETLNLLKALKDEGKTLLVVTHDLDNLTHHFDNVMLLNIEKIAFGPPDRVLTHDCLEATYGGHLHMKSCIDHD
jgi:manganese/zinc/iron transport system ATP- binding protein